MDDITKSWIRNPSDELAVANGCRFDLERAEYVVNWIETHCRLYEGSNELITLGDWQYEATMRLFGWIRWSERLGRWIRRFTRASIWLPKKSAKSPTGATWTLYLVCGDGERGQHVYFAAADGQQARIAAKHAIEMVKASPELSEDFDINLNEMKLTHRPTLSDAKPISSSDKRAAKAKQGLNGSTLIDECHVVSRDFISQSSIDKAGASRDEPLHMEVSTAGKDPDGYGRQQYEYGKLVEAGKHVDQAFFFLCYEAPQDLTDAELDADPVKYGKMANPTWGRIIQEDEFLADYRRSKRTLADLADFKTFRLNIWQTTTSPWLNINEWHACKETFDEEEMTGLECAMGLDLALTRDMASLACCFKIDDEHYRLLTYFFLPRKGFDRLKTQIPQLLEWERDGHIEITDGGELDFTFVEAKAAELADKFIVTMLVYDPRYAAQASQRIEENLGIERHPFAQQTGQFAEPMSTFENLVKNQALGHVGHPVMDWQIGHVNVKTDHNGYTRPVKPPRDDPKKIDGVVASIMALAGAMQAEVYNESTLRN